MGVPETSSRTESEFAGMRLTSVFQALHDLRAGCVFGHTASVRPQRDGEPVAITDLFHQGHSDHDIVRADRLCRLLHAASYHANAQRNTRLLVPVHARLLETVTASHGLAYREALEEAGLNHAPIVVCLPDPSHLRTMSLGYLIGSYRLHGFEIAVRLRDARNLPDLLARTRPTYVLVDHQEYAGEPARMAAAVKMAETAGTRTVFLKIETAEEAARVRAAGATLAQGYYFDRPAAEPAGSACD
jgi:EAL domain-containing protein (putative c-di-GMP-specific phosphodiesterase class I)